MSFLIVGDIHLGRSLSIGKPASGGQLNSRVQDQLDLLNWISEKAEELDVDHIFMTGDVYHESRPHPELIKHFMSWCKRDSKKKHIVVGNHDIIRSGSYTSSALDIIPALDIPGVHVYKNPAFLKDGDINITLLPFRDRRMYEVETGADALEKLSEEIAKAQANRHDDNSKHVLIGHLAIEGSMKIGDEISDTLNEIFLTKQWCSSWYHVWMGHVHHPQEIFDDGDCHISHVGSLDRSDFHKVEIDHPKWIVHVKDDMTFENIITPTRNLRDIEIVVPADKETTDYVTNELCVYSKKKSLENAIVRLHVSMSSEAEHIDRPKVQDYLYQKLGAHHICTLTESRAVSKIEFDRENMFDNEINPYEAVDRWAETRDDFLDEEHKERVKALAKLMIKENE